MTVWRTCKNCVLEKSKCFKRAALRDSVKGLGLTSVKFKCADRKPIFVTGQRVNVTFPVTDSQCDGEAYGYRQDISEETWPATIIRETKTRFVFAVDDVESDCGTPAREYFKSSLYASAPTHRISALDEPHVVVCEPCGEISPFTNCISCGGFEPFGCRKAVNPKAVTT